MFFPQENYSKKRSKKWRAFPKNVMCETTPNVLHKKITIVTEGSNVLLLSWRARELLPRCVCDPGRDTLYQ